MGGMDGSVDLHLQRGDFFGGEAGILDNDRNVHTVRQHRLGNLSLALGNSLGNFSLSDIIARKYFVCSAPGSIVIRAAFTTRAYRLSIPWGTSAKLCKFRN